MYLPEGPLIGDLVAVRPATDADADLLASWHAQPDISRQWGNETFTRDEIVARLQRISVDPYVIEERDRPVGYIQAWFDDDTSRAGLDMFLIGTARGRGLGPDAARTLMRWLFSRAYPPGDGRRSHVEHASGEGVAEGWFPDRLGRATGRRERRAVVPDGGGGREGPSGHGRTSVTSEP